MRCDHTIVAVMLFNPAGDLLVLEHHPPRLGMAPPAAHLGDYADPEPRDLNMLFPRAALRMVPALTGLRIADASLRMVIDRHSDDHCHRDTDGHPRWHFWRVFTAYAIGVLNPPTQLVRRAYWCNPAEVETLANRTVAWVRGELPHAAYQQLPGLDPMWVWWLHLLGRLPKLDPRDAVAVLDKATGGDTDPR